jgi:hypothetical protein
MVAVAVGGSTSVGARVGSTKSVGVGSSEPPRQAVNNTKTASAKIPTLALAAFFIDLSP